MIQKSEQEIIGSWKGDINIPIVSVSCVTYNHENYISEALDGFLIQKTEYPFEIVIGEDCSSDKTLEIIKRYKERYPHIINLIEWPQNVGAAKNWLTVLGLCKGKYIANCEGDDYWIYENKLQTQVDFLENNSEYSMCFHNAIVEYSDINIESHLFKELDEREYFGKELLSEWTVPFASVMFRRIYLTFIIQKVSNPDYYYGDIVTILSLCEKGKVYCMNSSMSVYRRHIGGITQLQNIKNVTLLKKILKHYHALAEDFDGKYSVIIHYTYSAIYLSFALDEATSVLRTVKYLIKAFAYTKRIKIKVLIKICMKIIFKIADFIGVGFVIVKVNNILRYISKIGRYN